MVSFHSLVLSVLLVAVLAFTGTAFAQTPAAARPARDDSAAEKLGFKAGVQIYSFNSFSVFESLDKAAACGVKYVEMFPGQKLSKEKPEVKVGPGMPADAQEELKKKLDSLGLKVVCFGVTGIPGNEAGARKVFDWAQAMGIENIACEPNPTDKAFFDLMDKLTEEYKINVALHNHPKNSTYWNPDTVLKAVEGRGKRIGACADTGHWMRSGLNPVECLKKLEGRIMYLHFKDLDSPEGKGLHDMPWGTGKADVKAMLTELKRQGFKGYFNAEYEHNWGKNDGDIKKSVEGFDKICAEIAK